MARINIEQSLFSDYRFQYLSDLIGRQLAQGVLLDIFFVAQKYWIPNQRPVPLPEFLKIPHADKVLKAGLADVCSDDPDFVYIRGSKEQFSWLIQRSESGKIGSRITNDKRWGKKDVFAKSLDNSVVERSSNGRRTVVGCQPLTPTLTLTHKNKDSSDFKKSPECISSNQVDLVKIWNENCGSLPKVCGLSKKRQLGIKARLKENPSEQYWITVVSRIASTPFCNGDNERGWRASFDFLLRPDTHLKVMEGQYASKHNDGPRALNGLKIVTVPARIEK